MANRMCYNESVAVAGHPETNTEASSSGTDVLVYLVADPYTSKGLRKLLPAPVISTSAPDGGASLRLRQLVFTLALALLLLAGTLVALASSSSVSGRTWIYYGSTFVRWSGVDVQLIRDGQVVSTTVSGEGGEYAFTDVVSGTYDLVGDVQVGCSCYHGLREGVVVSGTVGANVLLYWDRPCCRYYFPVIMKGW